MGSPLGRALRHAKLLLRDDIDLRFLPRVHGIIHVGANIGQERHLYDDYDLAVLWIEPLPEIFAKLRDNIARFPRQRALQCLVADRDGVPYPFHVANNQGASSSMFDFGLHGDIWPDVTFEKTISLEGLTLPSLIAREGIDLSAYDALVIDTQGSELLVLRGAALLLPFFQYVKLEAADFELYAGCCRLEDVETFLKQFGFREFARRRFAKHPAGGGCYDVIYERRS
ncbi:MAG TPA: FkbM family methyltransferase [Thermoanaerobaculia bacterium]|nr:FkbM family methyltransferase [Thermoanaerobaculia bacterium]